MIAAGSQPTIVVFGDPESEPLLGAFTLEGFLLAADLEGRVEGFEDRFAGLERRMDRLDARFDALDTKVDRFRDELAGRIEAVSHGLSSRIEALDLRLSGAIQALDHKISRNFIWTVGIQVAVLLAVVTALTAR